MDIEFNSAAELYERVKPALRTKLAELKREDYYYLTMEDIWNYLKENKLNESKNLSLNDMVSDILNSENVVIDAYFKNKITRRTRRAYLDS